MNTKEAGKRVYQETGTCYEVYRKLKNRCHW
uniref:Uncharacterized protein n=1 Tax=Arundo donax TaxID=35708 RepID=A0A0A8YB50_ARUDO